MQGHVDAVGKVTLVDDAPGGTRVWIRPPKRFLDEVASKWSVAVDGVSMTVAELLADRFSVALIPITRRESTLGALVTGDRVNLESDLVLKAARDLHTCARLVPARSLAGLPWAGELRGAHERAATIRRLAHPGARPEDFLRPGHVFPLAGRRGGLAGRGAYRGLPRALRRRRPPPVAAICEVMGPDGYMLTGSAVQRFALRWGIPMIAVDDLASWL